MAPDDQDTDLDESRGLFRTLLGDGSPLLALTGLALIFSGLFAMFLAATGHFLPHDVAFLGMSPDDLGAVCDGRVVHFMAHDRVSFGGTLIAVGTLYLWLVAFPLKHGEPWAWWLFALSGLAGFASFLLYLGYGYLDTWHGVATLVLLPCYGAGLAMAYPWTGRHGSLRSLGRSAVPLTWQTGQDLGRLCLLAMSLGIFLGGVVIMGVGATRVFVPQDLEYIGMTTDQLHALNPRLVPLIAHDRAGFGGGLCCCGVTLFFSLWCGCPSRSLWQAVFTAGLVGFGSAIGIHPAIGYTSLTHLTPAYLGAALFLTGIVLTYQPARWSSRHQTGTDERR